MRGKGVLKGNSCFRNVSKKTKTVNNGKVNVVLIDLDDDNVVIIDDVAEPLQKNFGKSSVDNVIHIDDDDDTVGASEANGELDSDASSSKRRFPMFKTMGSSVQKDTDECQFVKDKTSAFQFSKCKQTYCTKSPATSRFGLDSSFDNVPTDDDSSDCVIVAESQGKFSEDWKRASVKGKRVAPNRSSGAGNQSSSSESNNVSRTNNAEETRKAEQHHNSGNADNMRKCGPQFVATNGATSSANADQKSEEKRGPMQDKESFVKNKSSQPEGGSVSGYPHYNDNLQPENKEGSPQDCHFFNEFENYKNDCSFSTGFWKDEEPRPHWFSFRLFEEVGVQNSTHQSGISMEKENIDSGQPFVPNSGVFDEGQVDNGVPVAGENSGGGPEDILSRCNSAEGKPEESFGKACHQEEVRADCVGDAVRGSSVDIPSSSLNESPIEGMKEPNGLIEEDPNVTPSVENCLITDREKLKGTDEFKQAIAEEWAARQLELQIQAEEAKRLRKRKKAEIMRLCDIERRQKQRVEEVRQTQKKNAEDINLKEKFRSEIRKEINRLEITCINMASLLRGLGITVNGGFNPMSDDVNAAYKRALLKFHPDRASRMDIRQQVEAEEKFKLISRMKEKFLTSCH